MGGPYTLSSNIEEILYPAMEDFQLDLVIGEGPSARSIKIDLPPFTLVGATTRSGLLTTPLRDRFGIQIRMEYYNTKDLVKILLKLSKKLNVKLDENGAFDMGLIQERGAYDASAQDAAKAASTQRGLDMLKDAGMLVTNDKGCSYDRFRKRVMFPIRVKRGRVIAFGGRALPLALPWRS